MESAYPLIPIYREKTESQLRRERKRWTNLLHKCQCEGSLTDTGKIARGRLLLIEQVQRERMLRRKAGEM